ncbi:hypothetical protein BGX38DRAFT_1242343 [Terfezia claveryi]|nr:hypothetical protein BGX38DRAFT_1242343 [Terfezia claveryi]
MIVDDDEGGVTEEDDTVEGEEEEEIQEDNDDDAEEDIHDPFEMHFANPPKLFLQAIEAAKRNEWSTTKTIQPAGNVGKISISVPAIEDPRLTSHTQYVGKKVLKSTLELKLKPLFSYTDLYISTRTHKNAPHLRHLYALHALNHIYKTRDRVLKNNAKLAKIAATASDDKGSVIEPPDLRDQGFTRPKILIILPTRNAAWRLNEQFGLPAGAEDPLINSNKPEDFKALFAGNHDDDFRIGIKFTRKTIKYFSSFYNSDIILASPLGLKLAIGASEDEAAFANEGKARKKNKNQKQDYDFLSSIEVCIVDHADAMRMQNWEHLEFCMKHINLIPRSLHDTDFSRVREWCLDSHSPYFRQTVLLSSFQAPEFNSFQSAYMRNALSGHISTRPGTFPGQPLKYLSCLGGITQTFHRFSSQTPLQDPDARFEFFMKTILPTYILSPRAPSKGILIFIPNSFDFLRVRNHFAHTIATPISFGSISEHTSPSDIARARTHFANGRYRVLLYSGRAHHYRRYVIKGTREVWFYGVPEELGAYEEVGAFLAIGDEGKERVSRKVASVFSKWEGLAVERVVGSERVGVMVQGRGDVFEFL